MIYVRLHVLAFTAALVLGGESVSACSCTGPPGKTEEIVELMGDSDVVLLGRLEEGTFRIWALEGEEKQEFYVTITTLEWFKGEHRAQKVEIALAAVNCLSGFRPGNSVLIFASESEGRSRPETHSCRMYVYELARPEGAFENVELRKRLDPTLKVIRSRSW